MNYRNTLLALTLIGSTFLTTSCGDDNDSQQQVDDNHETDSAAGGETGGGSGPDPLDSPQGDSNNTTLIAEKPEAQKSLNKIVALKGAINKYSKSLQSKTEEENKKIVTRTKNRFFKKNPTENIGAILATLKYAAAKLGKPEEGKEKPKGLFIKNEDVIIKMLPSGFDLDKSVLPDNAKPEVKVVLYVIKAFRELNKLEKNPPEAVDYTEVVEKQLDQAIAAVPSDS